MTYMANFFIELEQRAAKYRNLIGIAVIITILLGSVLVIVSKDQVKEYASQCGFDDGDLRCVCTQDAWNIYQEGLKIVEQNGQKVGILTTHLNSSSP